jgi:hypothetical protein
MEELSLIRLAQKGDTLAFRSLFEENKQQVFSIAFHYLKKYFNGRILGGVEGGVEGGLAGRFLGGVEGGQKKPMDPDLELKLIALDALMSIDKEKAFPILEKMVK